MKMVLYFCFRKDLIFMPVTEEEIKKGLTEACKKFKAVLMSQKSKEPYGNDAKICCKGFCDFCKSLRETYALMKKYADEHGVKKLEHFWNDGSCFDMSVSFLFYRQVDRQLKMDISDNGMASKSADDLLDWFDCRMKSVELGSGKRPLRFPEILERLYDEKITYLMRSCKEVFEKAKKVCGSSGSDPELAKHFKASYLTDLKTIKQRLKGVKQNPLEMTPAIFESYVKIIDKDLKPIAFNARWLWDNLPSYKHSECNGVQEGIVDLSFHDRYSFDYAHVETIKKLFKDFIGCYHATLSMWIKNLDKLIEDLAHWKPIDPKWIPVGDYEEYYDPKRRETIVRMR